ncbi:MAG: glycine hydroxymethyltransferase [bacterium]
MTPPSLLESYLASSGKSIGQVPPGMLAYLANLDLVVRVSPDTARGIVDELAHQRSGVKLIASENYSSLAVQAAMANLLTDKYAEGVPYKRFYAGCESVDAIEQYAADRACELFGATHAYVQPHSGADANLVAFWAILSARVETPALAALGETDPAKLDITQWGTVRAALGNQRLLGLDLYSGGHLSHGYRRNVSGRMFESHSYFVNRETNLLDYDEIERIAREVRPLILLAGYSAYSRPVNFARMREIADGVGAVLMVDMAHFAGLVAGKLFTGDFDPVAHAQVVTSTTHKTLRGPRGGLVLTDTEFAEHVDKGCPLVLGGPLPHVMAAKAVAFTEALLPSFRGYAAKIVENARALSDALIANGHDVLTGGTDNHLVLVDVGRRGLTGRQGESALRECGLTLNRNTIPFDPNGPWYTSGLRLGTPATTTLGMGAPEMQEIASIIALVLAAMKPAAAKDGPSKAKYIVEASARDEALQRVKSLLSAYPVYPELDLAYLQGAVGA